MTALVPLLDSAVYVARWRIQPNGKPFVGLPMAISAVRRAYPDRPELQQLAYFLCPRLPGKPRTSENLKTEGAFSQLTPLEDVITTAPWLALNTEEAINSIWAESDNVDFDACLSLMREWDVPVSAWTARGKVGGHIAYMLDNPVATGRNKERDRRMTGKAEFVHYLLRRAINGDANAGLRSMTKNPFCAEWAVSVGDLTPCSINDLLQPLLRMAKALGWKWPPRRFRRGRKRREASPDGRNCYIFDIVRWWAYDGFVVDGASILAKAEEVNASFATPLSHREVAGIAKSITRFMRQKYEGAPTKAIETRNNAVLQAFQRLQARGAACGQKEVAAEAGVSIRTAQRAWSDVWAFVNQVPPSVSSIATTPIEMVEVVPDASVQPSDTAIQRQAEAPAASTQSPQPEFRLIGHGDPVPDPRFLPKRARAAIAKYERDSWHRQAALRGAWAYKLDYAARLDGLFFDKRLELDCLRVSLSRAIERWHEDPIYRLPAMIAAQERLKIATFAWASRLKAEQRAAERTRAGLPPSNKVVTLRPKFRTEPDAIDIMANGIADRTPLSQEEQNIQHINARMTARQDAIYGIVDKSQLLQAESDIA